MLVADATSIRTAGISLNLISQQYTDQRLLALLESGASIQCLFLDPQGSHIREREHEEGYPTGDLSSLTQLNIDILKRFRDRVTGAANERFEIAVYDEVPRFNIVLIDHPWCRPALHATHEGHRLAHLRRGRFRAARRGRSILNLRKSLFVVMGKA